MNVSKSVVLISRTVRGRPGVVHDGAVTGEAAEIAFVRVLGPIQAVSTSGHSVDVASASQRRLVAVLAAEAPRSVRAERIQDLLAVSPSALRTTVSRVRKALGADAISGPQGHYRLALPVDI